MDERDGTEIEDDDVLLECAANIGQVLLLLGANEEWTPPTLASLSTEDVPSGFVNIL